MLEKHADFYFVQTIEIIQDVIIEYTYAIVILIQRIKKSHSLL